MKMVDTKSKDYMREEFSPPKLKVNYLIGATHRIKGVSDEKKTKGRYFLSTFGQQEA